jgi:hypothetical protein
MGDSQRVIMVMKNVHNEPFHCLQVFCVALIAKAVGQGVWIPDKYY